jgi:hypothetical protein
MLGQRLQSLQSSLQVPFLAKMNARHHLSALPSSLQFTPWRIPARPHFLLATRSTMNATRSCTETLGKMQVE